MVQLTSVKGGYKPLAGGQKGYVYSGRHVLPVRFDTHAVYVSSSPAPADRSFHDYTILVSCGAIVCSSSLF
jgi:hypothetical protein